MRNDSNPLSLREQLLTQIGSFLYEEQFKRCDITKHGILEIINLISDYHEEGIKLHPEIVITNNLELITQIPNNQILIKETKLTQTEFKNAIKLCAPLTKDNWVVFIEVADEQIKYGVINANISETSFSLYEQIVGELKQEFDGVAYLRNIASKTVELIGSKGTNCRIYLNLEEINESVEGEIVENFAECIVSDLDKKHKVKVKNYFEKMLDDTLKSSHGNLIAVIKSTNLQAIENSLQGGIFLNDPIDFSKLISTLEDEQTIDNSTKLRQFSTLAKEMINQDGISLFTTDAKLIGYHHLVKSSDTEDDVDKPTGGARSQAFESIKALSFNACLFRSQDGNMRLWSENE